MLLRIFSSVLSWPFIVCVMCVLLATTTELERTNRRRLCAVFVKRVLVRLAPNHETNHSEPHGTLHHHLSPALITHRLFLEMHVDVPNDSLVRLKHTA